MAEQLLLLILAAVGWRKRQMTWPLVVSLAVLILSYMVVAGRIRYALPVMPLTISLGALGIAQVAERFRLPERNRVTIPL